MVELAQGEGERVPLTVALRLGDPEGDNVPLRLPQGDAVSEVV
jgi:hypothetical protein